MSNLFKEEKYNALYQALEECAKDEDQTIYEWLDDTPKTSLVAFLVDKLEELGYLIVKK